MSRLFVTPAQARLYSKYRTMFDTTDPFDAGVAGFDGPTDPDDGGVRVFYDATGSIPEAIIIASDGRITGAQLMGHVIDALISCRALAVAQERS